MKVIFLGGDLRQKYATDYLNSHNISSEFYGDILLDEELNGKIYNASAVILPIPVSRDNIHLNTVGKQLVKLVELVNHIGKNCIVFGGKFPNNIRDYFIENKISYIDYFDIESFQIKNALLTAEGAIYYAKQRMDKSIHGLEIAILGFGRIGKMLAYLLRSQGAKITVCVRKDSDCTWSRLTGLNGCIIENSDNRTNININNRYDLIFNTIPSRIMDEEFAKNNNSRSIIIDLASYPFGIDESLVNKYNLKYYRELGIPGRYAPISAGEIIGQTIMNYLDIKED